MKTIELTQGLVAVVDDQDFAWLSQWKWYANKSSYHTYAARFTSPQPRQKIYMHREIARRKYADQGEVLDGREVDHEDGDPLNNRRENLIARSRQENLANRRGKFSVTPCRATIRSK